MSIELIAILAGYGLTGLVWWRMESLHRSLKQTMMAQFGYVIREIRRVDEGGALAEPEPGSKPARKREGRRAEPQPAIAD